MSVHSGGLDAGVNGLYVHHVYDERFEMRASADWLKALDDWRRKQPGAIPSRAEAIRTLVTQALSPKPKR